MTEVQIIFEPCVVSERPCWGQAEEQPGGNESSVPSHIPAHPRNTARLTQPGLQEPAGLQVGQQRLWNLLLGGLPMPPGLGPGHPALGVPAGAGVGAGGHRGPFQPFCEQQQGHKSSHSPRTRSKQNWHKTERRNG